MTDRDFLKHLADWLTDMSAQHAHDAHLRLARGDASALHWRGVAQGYLNVAATIEGHCQKPAAAGDQPEVEGAPV